MEKREKLQYVILFLSDAFCLAAAFALAWWVCRLIGKTPRTRPGEVQSYILMISISYLCGFLFVNRTRDFWRRNTREEFMNCVKSILFMGAIMSMLLILSRSGFTRGRYLFVLLVILAVMMEFGARCAIKKWLQTYFYRLNYASMVAGIGTVGRVEELIAELKRDFSKKIQGVVIFGIGHGLTVVDHVPVVGSQDDFMDWVKSVPLDEVYVNVPSSYTEEMMPFINEMESMGLDVHMNVPILELYLSDGRAGTPHIQKELETVAGIPFVTLSEAHHSFDMMVIKRIMDIVGSIIGIIISIPVIALVAIPLKLESPGPLFFKQIRVGLNGREFRIYKLRSMYKDAEQRKKELMARNKMSGQMFKVDNDPRITHVGRFIRRTSIDELPQFLNVLIGDMSLVGTRPPTKDEYKRYESRHLRRLSMKPGITGLWQISGRSNIRDFEKVVEYDTRYIDNWSIWLDIRILLKTVQVVITGRGAE